MTLRHLVVGISEQRGSRGQVIAGLRGFGLGQVDADDLGQRRRDVSLETLGMRATGGLQHSCALFLQRQRTAEVYRRRRHEADGGMSVFVVVQVDNRAPMLVTALVDNHQVIRRILEHLGLWAPERTAHPPPIGPDAWPAHASLPLTYTEARATRR